MQLSTTFNQLEATVSSRHIVFLSTAYVQALNGETVNGQLACNLRSGQPFQVGTSYDVLQDFYNCSTANGGFNVASLSSTVGVSTLYFYYGYNGPCSALYGPLVSPASQSTPLQANTFSVGGAIYVRLGDPGCVLGSVGCDVPSLTDGICDSQILPENTEVRFARLDLSITDQDGLANTLLAYTITDGDVQGVFAMNSSTGQLSVRRPLDRDSGNSMYRLTVTVSNEQFDTTLTIIVQVLDENDNDPVPSMPVFRNNISEGLPVATYVLTADFTDQDDGTNAILRYSIVPPSSDFAILDITVANITTQRVFDFDAGDRFFTFVIAAQDISSSPRTGTANVEVTITDVNDNRPFLEATVRGGTAYVEDFSPVNPASVTVSDADSGNFPMLYATVTIRNPLDGEVERLDLPQMLLPSGFKLSYSNFTLFIVGSGTPQLYAQLLSSVTYENLAVLFELPLYRNISYAVCDIFQNPATESLFTADTQRAFAAAATSSSLPDADAALLLGACLEVVSDEIELPLVETNDRPVVLGPAQFPSVSEDITTEENSGSFIFDVFDGDVITDSDRNDVLGIAVVGNAGPARADFGQLQQNADCFSVYQDVVSMGPSGCQGRQLGSSDFCACSVGLVSCVTSSSEVTFTCLNERAASLCTCPLPSQAMTQPHLPRYTDIRRLELEVVDTGVRIGISSVLSPGTALDITLRQLLYFISSQSRLIVTLQNSMVSNLSSFPFTISYESIGTVSETSALVLGPYHLVRWVPINNINGLSDFDFKAWDGTNGVSGGSRNIDTTLPNDSSFSLETANATVEVMGANDPPIIRLGGRGEDQLNYATNYTEGGAAAYVSDRNAVVIELDPSDLFLYNLTVSISGIDGNCDLVDFAGPSQDRLSYLNTTMVPLDEVVVSRTGQACITYSFLGSMSVDNWRTFITMIRFSVEDEEPSDHTRQLAFTISDRSSTSMSVFTTIDVELVSDMCPVISLVAAAPVNYTEHSSSVAIDPSLSVSDGDRDATLSGATIQILTTQDDPCTTCVLSVNSTGLPAGVTVSGSGLSLTISGTSSPEEYQAILRTVAFEDTGDEPSFELVQVRFILRDPTLTPTSCPQADADIGVMIHHLNDIPAVIYLNYPNSRDHSATFTEGMGSVRVTGMVNIIDADSLESDTYRVDIAIVTGCDSSQDRLELPSGASSTVLAAYNANTCSLTLEASSNSLEEDLSQLVYINTNADNPSPVLRSIVFTVRDSNLTPMSARTSLTIIPINDRPRIDLNIASPVSSDAMVILRDEAVRITAGAAVTDVDNDVLVRMSLVLTEIDSLGTAVERSDQAFEALELSSSITLSEFGLSGTFISSPGQFIITGTTSTGNYTTILNNILYANRRSPPSDNRRRVAVSVSDGSLTSEEVVSIIAVAISRNPPTLDLNGEESGTDVEITYTLTEPPLTLFPTASLVDIDGDNICTVNISMTGPDSTCLPTGIEFANAYSDISVEATSVTNGVHYVLTSRFTDCREAIVFEDVLRGVQFFLPDTAVPGTCTLRVSATDNRDLSDTNMARVEVIAFNAPPFIDLDLGLVGRDYSTRYFQGGLTKHIVSIYNATLARNITDVTVIGEAADLAAEAPAADTPTFDDGTFFHGVVIAEESYAGYVLRDVDSPTLMYLQVEFFAGANLDYDVISFPCEAAESFPAYGCNSPSSDPISFLAPRCNNSVFEACTTPDAADLCSDLRVTIFCSTVGRKAYRFEYTRNGLTSRYETLLGLLGYDFLLSTDGPINQMRLLNISVLDPLSEAANPLAITRIRILNQDVLIIESVPDSFHVYEDERPGRTCNLYRVRVRRLDGTVPAASEVVFNIIQGNIGNAFGIREDGYIFLNRAVDREVLARYNLTVTARIRTSPPDTTASAILTGIVRDVNDNHPITADSYTVNVTEATPEAHVVHVIATDADEGQNAELSYLLLGIGAELFQVDDTGLVTTRVALNRTLEDYYLLVMIIMDRGEIFLSTHTVINVMVVPRPPTNLIFNPASYTYNVTEDTRIGTELSGPPLSAFESGGTVAGDPANIRYRFVQIISGTSGLSEFPNPFSLNARSGVISVNSGLDSERSSNYSAVVEAFSISTFFPPSPALANITFFVQDVSEFPPMFVDAPYNFQVAEDAPVSTTIATFVATDNDTMNRGLVYSLSPNAPSSLPFQVEADGDLVITTQLDFEQTSTYTFQIIAHDIPFLSMSSMSGSATVTITILDVNDNSPIFTDTPYNRSVLETASEGYVVLRFSTTDADSDINSIVQYSITGLDMTIFCFDASARTIAVCNATILTSVEMNVVFEATLVATNPSGQGTPRTLQNTADVNITLVLVNEFPPTVFPDTVNHGGFHEEHCGRGRNANCLNLPVYDFSTISSDEDGGDGGTLTYFFATSEAVPFSLNSVTGELLVNGRIDREMEDFYTLLVTVSDGGDSTGNNARTAQVTINIPIYDIDDNPPEIIEPFVFNVTEVMTTTTDVFGRVNVRDPDINGSRIYQVFAFTDPPRSQGCTSNLPIFLNINNGDLSFCRPVDFETGPTQFTFTVSVIDTGRIAVNDPIDYERQRDITVNIVDSNDNPPFFPPGQNFDFDVPENEAAGTSVGSVRAEDIDAGVNGLLVFAVVNGSSPSDCSDDVPFYAVKTSDNTTNIIQCQSLDFEEQQLYSIVLQVSDSAPVPMSATTTVSVGVMDRNDNAPMFDSDTYIMSILETDSSLMMSAVLRVSVSDLDSPPNGASTFRIISPSPSPFGLRATNTTSAEVYVADPEMIDFESGITSYELIVQATNPPAITDDITQFANTTVIVRIQDVGDNAPVIMEPFIFDSQENQREDTVVGRVQAQDSDSGINAELNYYIGNDTADLSCSSDIPFRINISTGYIVTCEPLDYETMRSHSFLVIVCDRADPPMCSNMTFTVNVVDLNDNPPVYDQDPFIANLNEHSPNGTSVDFITSRDADSPANSMINYSLITSLPFAIIGNEVVFNGDSADIDFEGLTRTYIVNVRGVNPPSSADDDTHVVEVALVVNILDRNDQPPVFPARIDSVEIEEHTDVGTVIYELSSTDADTLPNAEVTYSIVQPLNTPFAIDGSNVVVRNSSAIDYDPPLNIRNYMLTIRATNLPATPDDQTQTADFSLLIAVNDTNDNIPSCVGPSSFMRREDSLTNIGLVRLMAEDIDSGVFGNQGIMFFTSDMGDPVCSPQNQFSIDPDSGYISTCVPFDYEERTSYELNFTVCDNYGRPMSHCVNCPVTLIITDVNDNAPIVNPPTIFNVSELAVIGTQVGCVNAEDADSGQNARLEYRFADTEDVCSSATPFDINEFSGCITVCQLLDYESYQSYSFDINVTDSGSPQLNNITTFIITIINENDHPPVIISSNTTTVEEEEVNALVIRVLSRDIDLPPFNVPRFSLLDDAGGSFEIDELSGVITTRRPLDREEQETYILLVQVSDGLNTGSQRLTVVLEDINDNSPEYLGETTFTFDEEFLFSTMLIFRDNDTGVNANLTYSVSDPRFAVSSEAVLSNLQPLDRDRGTGGNPVVEVVVVARDSTSTPLSQSVDLRIQLTDINDNSPMVPPIMGDIIDGSRAGTVVHTVRATDFDTGLNAELRYFLGSPSAEFTVNEISGEIILREDIFIMSNTPEVLPITVNVSDRGMPVLTTSVDGRFFLVSSVPTFPPGPITFSVSENSLGEVIGVIPAMDRDLNEMNDVFAFYILSVSPYDAGFTVTNNGGPNATLITPREYFDFEDATTFYITIGVGRNLTEFVMDDNITVILTVVETNDNVPKLSPVNITVQLPESTPVNTVIAQAVAIDFDVGNSGMMSYNLTGTGAELFSFTTSGELVLSEPSIDFENVSSYELTYQACDGGVPVRCSQPGYVFIEIIDVDDLPPVFSPSRYSMEIPEGFGNQRLVLFMNLTDEDTPLSDLQITLSPPQPSFQVLVVSNAAALMTTDVDLDRETQALYEFRVIATDPAGSSATASVTIRILDENDERPRVEPQSGLVVEFTEEGPAVFPGTNLTIVDGDTLSLFPLSSVEIALQQSPTSSQGYPIPGGVCDHANYSSLFDSNTHRLCGQEGCTHLLREGDVDLRTGGTLENGILNLPGRGNTARNPEHLFNGEAFETFTITIWVRFPAATRGNILEVQGPGVNVVELFVDESGVLSIVIRPSPTNSRMLLSTTPLQIHDGNWHQIGFVRNDSLIIYFDSVEVASATDQDDIPTDFRDGSFFLGFGLGGVYLSEFYFCSGLVLPISHISCTFSCGEYLDVLAHTPWENVTVNLDPRTRSIQINYVGLDPFFSLSSLENALDFITYRNGLSEPHPLDRGLHVLAVDQLGPSDISSVVTLRPVLINDQRPILDLNGLVEDGINFVTISDETTTSSAIISMDAILYDRDSGFWPVVSLRVQLLQVRGHSFQVLGMISPELNYGLSNGGRTLDIFPANPLQPVYSDSYISFLHQVRYTNMQEEPDVFDASIQFTVTDTAGFTNSPPAFTNITVIPVNDGPELDLDTTNAQSSNAVVTYEERNGVVNLLSGTSQSITDSDSMEISRATITLTLRPDGQRETLRLDPQLGIQLDNPPDFDPATGVLLIMHTDNFVTWLTILRSVQYINEEQDPSDLSQRRVMFVIQDDGGASSQPAYVDITLLPANNPPELFLGGPTTRDINVDFTEDGPCVSIAAPDLRLIDGDSSGIQLVRGAITGINVNRSHERFDYNGDRPFGFVNQSSDVFIILSPNSVSDYEAVLRNVLYCNTEDEPNEIGGRRVLFTVIDTGLITQSGRSLPPATSAPAFANINIIRVNDRPAVFFIQLDDVSIRNIPTPIINSSTIRIDDSDDQLFDILRIFITNPQDGSDNEIIEFSRQLPESSISVGPTNLPGPQILYTVTFTGGADVDRVTETISQLRYNNRAPDVTVDPPREICVELSDFKIFSNLTCVNVTISPPNNFAPVFDPNSVVSFNIQESDDPITLTTLRATDDDTGREGTIVYSVNRVTSTIRANFPRVTTTGIFTIDSSGVLRAPDGLNAEAYIAHEITVVASDQGNPVLETSIILTVNIMDINDEPPVFTGTLPYVADPRREELDPPIAIFVVRAADRDIQSTNVRYELLNFQDRFRIDESTGVLEYYQVLDADEIQQYVLNISATDSGNPPLVSYTTVTFNLIDTNDNAAVVDQLTPAVYVVDKGFSSIGPAIRIVDGDLDPPAISSISIVLTPNSDDLSRTYDQCLVQCQDARLAEAGLLSSALDLLDLASFTRATATTIGTADCPAITIARNDDRLLDGYGEIPRSVLPTNFASGAFSLSFVLTQTAEGVVLMVPDSTNRALPYEEVERIFAIWIRRRDFRFSYQTAATGATEQRAVIALSSTSPISELFSPDSPLTRHYTVVVSTNPARLTLYVDCVLFDSVPLVGDVVSPDPNINFFIGRAQPHSLRGGRITGQFHGLYYHPTALTESQITEFCSCGFEALILPSLPDSIVGQVSVDQHSITLQPSSGLIPNEAAINVLRSINYTNQFDSPTVDPTNPRRTLGFTITEETGIIGFREGFINLVSSDNNLPEVDLNGFSVPGTDTSAAFVEDGGSVLISPMAVITRTIEGFIDPTFSSVRVQLTNAIDDGEVLNATGSDVISVTVSQDGRTLDIVGPGVPVEFNRVLQSVSYTNLNQNPTLTPSRIISYEAFDTEGRFNSQPVTTTITLTSTDDAPTLSLSTDTNSMMSVVRFEEGSSGVVIAPNITVVDVDSGELVSAEVILTSPMLSTDMLNYTAVPGISFEYITSTGTLHLTGRATLARYQSALSNIVFFSTDSPFLDVALDSLTRTVTIRAFDGEENSETVSVQVQFMPNNDAPVITLPSTTITFRDGDGMIPVAPSATITDSDNRQLQSMRVELESNLDNDFLNSDMGNQAVRVLVFNQGSVADYVSLLRSVTYINPSPEPSLIPRTINIEVCDFMVCAEAEITVEIQDVNDNRPMFSRASYDFTITEDSAPLSTVGTLNADDADIGENIFSFSTDDPFFVLRQEDSSVHILTNGPLDFEAIDSYNLTVRASDGENSGTAQVTVNVLDVNEPPIITFTPPNPTLVVGPASENRLIQVQLTISDPDFGDTIPTALLTLRDVPEGSNESLIWEQVPGYTFLEVSSGVYRLSGPGDSLSLTNALSNVIYIAGEEVTQPTTIRTVTIVLTDGNGVGSREAVVTVSLSSIPQFTQEVYSISLLEETILSNFLQVEASVESGGDVITYAVEEGRGVVIDNSNGQLSLVEPVDREDTPSLVFSVFAIDALPPARTGMAIINITILDRNDVTPSVTGLRSITVTRAQPTAPFAAIVVTDPDIIGSILFTTISLSGDQPLQPLPFTGRVCVDEPNVVDKMSVVCGGLQDGIVLLERSLTGDFSLTSDVYDNDFLTLSDSSYSLVNANLNGFNGQIDEFTFVMWVRAESSGYIAYFGTPDSTERYFALYYSHGRNQLIVTVKREGLSGLSAQVRISFQLTTDLADGEYHFVMLQYAERNLICVVDGEPTNSAAVVLKQASSIAQVFCKCNTTYIT